MALTRRTLLSLSGLALVSRRARAAPAELRVQRLSWAGLRVELGGHVLFIDPQVVFARKPEIGSDAPFLAAPSGARFAAVTHTHGDHFDAEALRLAVGAGGTVACHTAAAAEVSAAGFRPLPLALDEGVALSGFERDDLYLVPVAAADGWGDAQVSWVILGGGRRLFHGGDTIWHGRFRHIGRQYGPFDAAFLPINGVRQPGRIDPPLEALHTLGPAQAVDAAVALRARQLVPIHHGRQPSPAYVETEANAAAATAAGKRRGVPVQLVARGGWVGW